MVKRRLKSREGLSLTDYVTDRPYAASSMLAVALGRVFNTALNGRSDSYPELAASALPLELRVTAVPVRAGGGDGAQGEALARRLFEPLGWQVRATDTPLGPDPSWGRAPYVELTLTGQLRLADALSHLYVLLPVLDNAKHYWVGSDEVDKLVRRGEGWLAGHPDRQLIVRRYLAARRDYVEDATARLAALDDLVPADPLDFEDEGVADAPTSENPPQLGEVANVPADRQVPAGSQGVADVAMSGNSPQLGEGEGASADDPASAAQGVADAPTSAIRPQLGEGEGSLADGPIHEAQGVADLPTSGDPAQLAGGEDAPRPQPLKVKRLNAVLAVLREVGAHRVVDLGCGEGYYLRALLDDPSFTEIVGVDVSPRVLEFAEQRLRLDRRSDHQRSRITLRQSSVTYRDDLLAGFDAILLVEVIEHLEPDRIASLEATVFGAARPGHVVVTTPNQEYNQVYGLANDQLRHRDHRFEWTRAEFTAWAAEVAAHYGYQVEFRPVGEVDPGLGPPTQLALFSREATLRDSELRSNLRGREAGEPAEPPLSATYGSSATDTSRGAAIWQKVHEGVGDD
jgi:SAM-dependent methyltransferase